MTSFSRIIMHILFNAFGITLIYFTFFAEVAILSTLAMYLLWGFLILNALASVLVLSQFKTFIMEYWKTCPRAFFDFRTVADPLFDIFVIMILISQGAWIMLFLYSITIVLGILLILYTFPVRDILPNN